LKVSPWSLFPYMHLWGHKPARSPPSFKHVVVSVSHTCHFPLFPIKASLPRPILRWVGRRSLVALECSKYLPFNFPSHSPETSPTRAVFPPRSNSGLKIVKLRLSISLVQLLPCHLSSSCARNEESSGSEFLPSPLTGFPFLLKVKQDWAIFCLHGSPPHLQYR